MKRLYTSSDLLIVGHLAEVLKRRNIHCLVRNLYLTGGAGELPPTDIWPELWVDDDDYGVALRLIEEVLGTTGPPGPGWVCPDCGEEVEGQFAACWNCGTPAPPES